MRKLHSDEIERAGLSEVITQNKIPVTVILDNIRSGLNVGSIFRSADGFAVEQIILTGFTPQPPHREILKTALGSTESVNWQYRESVVNVLIDLKSQGNLIVSIEQTDQSIQLQDFSFDKRQKYCLILGNEVDGVSDEAIQYSDMAIEIPQAGIKHSLNVAVCGGIVLWEAFKNLVG